MKVVIVCEELIVRHHATEMLELLCQIYEEAKVFALVHHPGKILGPIEMRPITSSFLSRLVNSREELFGKWGALVPGAFKGLSLPSDTDLVISLSTGLAHGVHVPKKAKHLSYIYDFQKIQGGIFSSYAHHWQTKSLIRPHKALVSHSALKHILPMYSEVLHPVFKIGDWPLVLLNENQRGWKDYLIDTTGVELGEVQTLIQVLEQLGHQFVFIGQDAHLADLKKHYPAEIFWGERCAGELGPLLTRGRALISLGQSPFPQLALAALASGRPVIIRDCPVNREFIEEGSGIFVSQVNNLELKGALKQMDGFFAHYVPQKLRRNALLFSETKFKFSLEKAVVDLLGLELRMSSPKSP